MNRFLVTFVLASVFSVAAVAALWGMDLPLGVPGEWTWARIPWGPGDGWDLVLDALLLFLVAGAYGGTVWKGIRRVEAASPVSVGVWLAGLVLAAFSWLFVVQLCPPAGYGIEKSAYVLFYKASSGYFTEARTRDEPLGEYLADYEADIQSEDMTRRVLHHGTHPPGLFIGYRGLISLCESSPQVVELVLKTQPPRAAEMFEDIAMRSRSSEHPLTQSDRAALWLAAMLTQFSAALAVVPLFFLGRRIASARSAWIAAAFWPLVPALAIFLPKSDVLNAFWGTLFLAVWCSGRQRNSLPGTFLAGIIAWLGMMFSLALLPVAFLAGWMVLWELAFSNDEPKFSARIQAAWPLIVSGLIGFLVPAVLVSVLTKMNLFAVWWQNYQNHAEFYQHFPRSYWPWLGANLLEAGFSLGAPLCVLTAAAFHRQWTDRKRVPLSSWGPFVAFAAMMAVLWISGKNRGEAARLWLVIFPYFVWISARVWDLQENESSPQLSRWGLAFLILQMLLSWLTVLRVHGFPLG